MHVLFDWSHSPLVHDATRRLLSGAMASIFHGCRKGWSAEETLAWVRPLGLQFLSKQAMVDWVSGCVQSRAPMEGLIFRCTQARLDLVHGRCCVTSVLLCSIPGNHGTDRYSSRFPWTGDVASRCVRWPRWPRWPPITWLVERTDSCSRRSPRPSRTSWAMPRAKR